MPNYYVVDLTDRKFSWRKAGHYLLDPAVQPNPPLSSDDTLLVHRTNYDPVKLPCTLLLHQALMSGAIAEPKRTPRVIFFTGDSVSTNEVSNYRVEMKGFPPEKVLLFGDLGPNYLINVVLNKLNEYESGKKPPSEAALALKLFCEAWAPPDGRRWGDNDEFKVFPPKSKGDWLKPFELEVGGNADDLAMKLSQIIEGPALQDGLMNLLTAVESAHDGNIASAANVVLTDITSPSATGAQAASESKPEARQ